MKKFFFILFLLLLVFTVWGLKRIFLQQKTTSVVFPPHNTSLTQKEIDKKEETALFIPYWTLGEEDIDTSQYNAIIYFGVVSDTHGIDMTGDGYNHMQNFLLHTQHAQRKLLAIQMIDSELNTEILKNNDLQGKIIDQAVSIAKRNGFDGIVLDFELSGVPFDSLTHSITQLYANFAEKVHSEQLTFSATMYGDVSYRPRPYRVSDIVKYVDHLFVMAYDFHKAKGDPGANFPLSKNQDDDYDFKTMTKDFLQYVPSSKLTVTFGMFGYDWKVGEKGQSIAQATSLSLSSIHQKFLNRCAFTHCTVRRDDVSAETEVTYIDGDSVKHQVWFEDMQSVQKKKEFLKSQGIFSTAFWAYTYF